MINSTGHNFLILASIVASLTLCVALMPFIRKFSIRIGWIAQLRNDRWSSRPVPTLGGACIFLALWGILLTGIVHNKEILADSWVIMICAGSMFLLGLYDDARKLKPPTKLIIQLLAATILIFIGDLRIDFFPWPIANIILTYLWLVGITNAINLLDNMDGLAGGIAIISGGILGYFFWIGEQQQFLLITSALIGALLGFLIFNFPPAKVFMGNNGSMFIGFLLAALTLARQSQASNVFAALGVPTLVLLIPILDTTFVVITRLLRGQSPIMGGTDHTSHRLIAFGLSERQTVVIFYGVALISGIAAAGLEILDYDLSLVLIPILLISLALFTAHLGKVKVISKQPRDQEPARQLADVLTYQRRLFEILLDLVIIGFSYYLAYWTKYGLDMTIESMDLFMQSWPIAIGSGYVMFYLLGVYRGVWGFLGVNDLLRYAGAAFCAGCVAWAVVNTIYPETPFRGDIFIVFTLFLLIGLAGTRSSFQILDQFYLRRMANQAKTNILIYGADDSGELLLSWILRNPQLGYKPVGFLDDKPRNWGKYIHNVKVHGNSRQWLKMMERGEIQGVIIASRAQIDTPLGSELLRICNEAGVWVKLLQFELEDI